MDGHRCYFRDRKTDRETEIVKPGTWIVWEDDEFLYVGSEAACGLIQRLAQEQGHLYAVTENSISRRLVERGLVVTDREGRNTSRMMRR